MMLSGPDEYRIPPFQLRPNKFVDRMMFVDLISRGVSEFGAQNYAYISMGATFLHDHHIIYRRLGISSLISFGNDEDDIKRQKFNRPTGKMNCLEMDSAELSGHLDDMRKNKNVIVWLDFMSHAHRRSQLQQTEEVLKKLQPGDLLRITLNSEFRKFGKLSAEDKAEHGSVNAMAASKLTAQIAEFLPAKITTLSRKDFPLILANAVRACAMRALKHRPEIKIDPVLSTTYADGDQMLTVACAIRSSSEKKLPNALRLWNHRSKDWADLKIINVPDLSLREKQHIDRRLNYSLNRILRSVPFCPDDQYAAEKLKSAIDSYRSYHRYYPSFQHIDH